jgi:hypothetical protein
MDLEPEARMSRRRPVAGRVRPRRSPGRARARREGKAALKLSNAKLAYGDEQTEHLSVTVSPQYSGSTPYGSVTIKESTTTLCVITLKSAKGTCTLSAGKLPVGTYHVVATYGSSANFKGSASAKETLTVAK